MTHTSLTRAAAATAIIMMTATAARAEQVEGKFVRLERLATHYLLVLEGDRSFVVSSKVRNKNLQLIKALKEGQKVRIEVKGNEVVTFLTEGLAADRVIEREGVFARYDDKLRRLWFTDKTNYAVHPRLGRKSLTTLLTLERGKRVRVMVKRDAIIEVKSLRGGKEESPRVKKILQHTRIGDYPVKIKVKGDPRYKVYKIRKVGALELVISPLLPNGRISSGRITWERHKIEDIVNQAADARIAKKQGEDPTELDPFDKFQAGDMVRVRFDKGQLIKLTEKQYFLRLWTNGVWGPEPEGKPRDQVKKVSKANLSSRETQPLPGGDGELEVVVTRSRAGRKGLEFEVSLSHNAKGVILVELEARFQLSREPCMGPRDRPSRIESRPITLPMFTGQPQRFRHEVSNDEFLDGRVKVEVGLRNVVKITTKAAPKHLMRVLGSMWQRDKQDTEALKAIFLAAAENGDDSICQHLVTRAALVKPKDRGLKYALLKGLAHGKYKDLAPRLMLDVLGGLDRELKVWDFSDGAEIKQVPLPSSERPASYKRKLVALLGDLPKCLSGKWGKEVFELYQTRYQTLGDAIEKAWRNSPDQALDTLIPVVLRARNQKEVEQASRASQLLRKLGEPICKALFKRLRDNGIDPKPLEEALRLRSASSEDIVRRAVAALVNKKNEQIARKLSDMVESATEKHANKEFDEALKVVRAVLVEKPNHQEAKTLLPTILIDLARKDLKAGNRGRAAVHYQEALEKLKGGAKAKAAGPLAELLVAAANEEVEEIVLRSLPHDAGDKVRVTRKGELFKGDESPERGWIKVALKGDDFAYVRSDVVKPQPTKDKQKHYMVTATVTPFTVVKEQLDKAKSLSSTVASQADSVHGTLAAREAKILYDQGAYAIALPLFETAAELAPTDPRLSLRWRCWLSANKTLLMAGGAVLLLGLIIVGMQFFSRPKKVKFQGEFKHYGADRSARERDLDVDDVA